MVRDMESKIQNQHISVIGLGVAETANLNQQAIIALNDAQLVIGSPRQLETISHLLSSQQRAHFPKLKALKGVIGDTENVVVLGSGDPLYYGIGRWINKTFINANLQFFPAVSSITAACNQLAISQQEIKVLSLHGRPIAKLKVSLKANQTILVLTDKHSQPQQLAQLCRETGFNDAQLIICERLGYRDQKVTHAAVDELVDSNQAFDPLHVTFIRCQQNQGYLPEFPGIKDADFETAELGSKGMITKREVRLSILSLLQLRKGDTLWDIGAGCGGVAVELAYWQPQASVFAIEHNQQRFNCLTKNQQKFGVVSNLKTVFGRAPDALEHLPAPNKIFIGGSDGELPLLLTSLWSNLPEGGQIVVSAVMENTKSQLFEFYKIRETAGDCQTETFQIAVNRSAELAKQLIYRPALTVNLFSFTKRTHS